MAMGPKGPILLEGVGESMGTPGRGGGDISIYALYRYVPWEKIWFFRFSILKKGVILASFDIVFPV